jgi:heme/copper-type cytochrome/quinol oxidase subunit 2
MSPRRMTVAVVTAILGATVALVIESSGVGAPGQLTGMHQTGAHNVGRRVNICAADVEGLWRYTYGTKCETNSKSPRLPYSYHDLVLPANTQVELTVTANQGQHELRNGGLRLTINARAGATRHTSFRTMASGRSYQAVCPSGCGHDRSAASAEVIVLTAVGYSRWLTTQGDALTRQDAQTNQLRTDLINQGVFARSDNATTP